MSSNQSLFVFDFSRSNLGIGGGTDDDMLGSGGARRRSSVAKLILMGFFTMDRPSHGIVYNYASISYNTLILRLSKYKNSKVE